MTTLKHTLSSLIIGGSLLALSACSGVFGPNLNVSSHDFPRKEASEVFVAGFSNITERYLDPIPCGVLAVQGLKGLSTLDSDLKITLDGGKIYLNYDNHIIARVQAPHKNDTENWAIITALLSDIARSYSPDLQDASVENIYEAIFDSAIGVLDSYSRYANAEQAITNRGQRNGFGGLGFHFYKSGKRFLIADIQKGTPAASSKLRKGDELIAIDGDSVEGLSPSEVHKRLRGAIGSVVELEIKQSQDITLFDLLERQNIIPQTVFASQHDDILLLKIKGFNQGTTASIELEIKEADTAKTLKGMILDLRGNQGGLLKQSIDIADRFINKGDLLITKGRHPDSHQHYTAENQDLAHSLPLVVLIDGKSASASEVVAAALQDSARAVLVGSSSYGKGTVQTVVRLPNDGELTLTWSRFMAPSGYALHNLGVYPTICTSGKNVQNRHDLISALEHQSETNAILQKWRSVPLQDKVGRVNLRKNCPPDYNPSDMDENIARMLIEDASLYSRALGITPSLAQSGS